jgi:hypothetical protein
MMGVQERAVLAFERQWWRFPGAKAEAVRSELSMSMTRYHQILNRVIDDPEALAAEPVLVNRLRRARAAKLRARSTGLNLINGSDAST